MPNISQSTPVASESSADSTSSGIHYRSGAAARLAGIPVETLRVWERRYGVVSPPLSSGGRRLYSAENVQRLRLIKQLLARGNAIGVVATLSTTDLQQMLAVSDGLESGTTVPLHGPAPLRFLLVGEAQAAGRGRGYHVVASCPEIAQAANQVRGLKADLVVIETPSLMQIDPQRVSAIRDAATADAVVVLYRFGPAALIRQLREAGHVVVHASLDAVEFEAVCRTASEATGTHEEASAPPAVRFDTAALTALAGASSTIQCECPRHLAELLQAIQAFERYSGECGSRNPADAALHARLQTKAGHARALLEDALLDVALAEGLPLPERLNKAAA